ncbi:MAG: HEPN domain-containing protein [Fibrobacteres bacterium]|nr:HEPN domain-containing protein [Fibrobacterota bacterium]
MIYSSVPKWVIKAEHDLKNGRDQLATENPATDTICFHMQQCAEKYLKAFIVAKDKKPARTHVISGLLQICLEMDSEFQTLIDADCNTLTQYGVLIRYPDDFYEPTKEETILAIKLAEQAKEFVLAKLEKLGYSSPTEVKSED